ncbi:hypothetical protein [Kocuria sp. TGY1127_2]|uniref:hypothetical protein n=1 Tax=Kocuria sp. TGY1127_2 TaxID=2711328 RepID=UPI0015C1789A|nr:hypothetical protein [Kocuria sp. TGY1127_2]
MTGSKKSPEVVVPFEAGIVRQTDRATASAGRLHLFEFLMGVLMVRVGTVVPGSPVAMPVTYAGVPTGVIQRKEAAWIPSPSRNRGLHRAG